jgi:hypothetical protein
MADTQQLPQSGAAGQDPLAQLEALLKKTKQGAEKPGVAPAATTPPVVDPAIAAAEFAAAVAAGEELRMRQLAEQEQSMEQLHQTPQYQARLEHQHQVAEEKQAEQAANTGHEIRQLSETRVTE